MWVFLRMMNPCMKRCCDRGCTCNVKKTKKKTLIDYIALYTGEEFDIDNSYTDILKNVFISMSFGSVLPISYVISAIYLIILYYRDKILSKAFSNIFKYLFIFLTPIVLNLYRLPPSFDQRMNRQVRHLLGWCIPIFCISSIWAFGNSNILEKPSFITLDAKSYANSITESNFDNFFGTLVKFFDRATNIYGIPFFIVLLLFILIRILGFIIVNIFSLIFKLLCCCCHVKLKQDDLKDDMCFDARVPSSEMAEEFNLYNSLVQQGYYTNPSVKHHTEIRLKIYNSRLMIREHQGTKNVRSSNHFHTLASYNFRLNPMYKSIFLPEAIEETPVNMNILN